MLKVEGCDGQAAFQVLPEEEMELDLSSLEERLSGKYEVVACTSYVIVLKKEGAKISLYPTGKMMIRDLPEERVESVAEALYSLL